MLKAAVTEQHLGSRLQGLEIRIRKLETCLFHTGAPTPTESAATTVTGLPPLIQTTPLATTDCTVSDPRSSLSDQTPFLAAYDATTSTHFIVATRVFEQAVHKSWEKFLDSQLTSAVEELRDVIRKINDTPDSLNIMANRHTIDANTLNLPSRAEACSVLLRAEKSLTLALCPTVTAASLKEKCEDVFNHPKESGPVKRLLVFSCLFNLCMEHSRGQLHNSVRQYYSALSRKFLAAFEDAVAKLPLIVSETSESITALIVAASSAVALCRPQLALALTTAAASLVISLGYHRRSTLRSCSPEERDDKSLLFWMVFIYDTNFSVRLGRAPVIKEPSITVPRLSYDASPENLSGVFHYWAEIGGLQCEAVEQLFSPAALQKSLGERIQKATALSTRLQEVWRARSKTSSQPVASDTQIVWFRYFLDASNSVMHYSTLALVQHAMVSNWSRKSPALEAARHAVRLTIKTREAHKGLPDHIWSAHCHWTLLHAPFTPFTVIFCDIIARPEAARCDVRLLGEFVATLCTLSHLSKGVAKLCHLCDVFQKVADVYVQSKSQLATRIEYEGTRPVSRESDFAQPTVKNIDEYLSSVGFRAPLSNKECPVDGDKIPADLLDGWFHANKSLMELLEHDLAYDQFSNNNNIPV